MINLNEIGVNLNKLEIITLVGAGGKTSIMFDIADKLIDLNKKVLVTTSTKIYIPKREDVNFFIGRFNKIKKADDKITVAGSKIIENKKIIGYKKNEIDKIFLENYYDYILVEGDGAKEKSIKAPRVFEPIVPQKTSLLIGVIGMDVYGKKISEKNVFGLREFLRITNKNKNELIDKESIMKIIINKNGLFKYKANRNILVLNKINKYNKYITDEIKKYIEETDNYGINSVIEIEELL